MEGPKFLKRRFDLHKSAEVAAAAKRTKLKDGEKVSQKPEVQIQNYLNRFKKIIEREDEDEKKQGLRALKKVLHKKYIIAEDEIPESYFRLQQQVAREQGHGDIEVTDTMRTEAVRVIQTDQATSLDAWIDYLASDDALYPDWAKYWAFRSMLGMSSYDKEKHEFGKRSRQTTAPYPDLNREALAYAVDVIEKKSKGEMVENPVVEGQNAHATEGKLVSDEEFGKLLHTENFAKYYAFAIEHVAADNSELYEITDGEWRIFKKGSDPLALTSTIQGHGTGWCTAGESTAAAQLEQGDFHVYYSLNALGESKIPRLAIRMEGDHLAEVRGVAHQQEIDPYIAPVLEEKMDEFGEEGEQYKKKAENMKRLTEIDNTYKAGEELSREDLRFLWEMDGKIKGFGFERDPRIEELQNEKGGDLANHPTIVEQLIEDDRGSEVARLLGKFDEPDRTAISQKLLEYEIGLINGSEETFDLHSAEKVVAIHSYLIPVALGSLQHLREEDRLPFVTFVMDEDSKIVAQTFGDLKSVLKEVELNDVVNKLIISAEVTDINFGNITDLELTDQVVIFLCHDEMEESRLPIIKKLRHFSQPTHLRLLERLVGNGLYQEILLHIDEFNIDHNYFVKKVLGGGYWEGVAFLRANIDKLQIDYEEFGGELYRVSNRIISDRSLWPHEKQEFLPLIKKVLLKIQDQDLYANLQKLSEHLDN